MTDLVRQVAESIGPASVAHADAARARVAAAGAPMLERLAYALGGAQHTPRPRAERRLVVIVAGDHGVGDPGIAMGADHPTVVAAAAIAGGSAAICHVARAARTPIVLVDAGARERAHMPPSAIALGLGRPTHDLTHGPSMPVGDALRGLEAGIALAMSLSEPTASLTPAVGEAANNSVPMSLFSLGALGVGAEVASAGLLGAATGIAPRELGDPAAEAIGVRGAKLVGTPGLELLATFGGGETAVLAGLILGAASIDVPVLLDSYATGAAALVAVLLAPNVAGYLVAAHRGTFTQPAIVQHLGLQPLFDVGLGHGEGTGAAMALPLVDQVASLARQS